MSSTTTTATAENTSTTTNSAGKITTVLWFTSSDQAVEAAQFYTSIFPNSSITHTQRYVDTSAHAPPTSSCSDPDRSSDDPSPAQPTQQDQPQEENPRPQPPHHTPGSVMVISYTLFGNWHLANLNGGPAPGMHHTGAVSFQIDCDTQQEIDFYWAKLGEGGRPERQECGWVEDKFGVNWQVVPKLLKDLMARGQQSTEEKDRAGLARMVAKMLTMKKLDIEGLERAFEGV